MRKQQKHLKDILKISSRRTQHHRLQRRRCQRPRHLLRGRPAIPACGAGGNPSHIDLVSAGASSTQPKMSERRTAMPFFCSQQAQPG